MFRKLKLLSKSNIIPTVHIHNNSYTSIKNQFLEFCDVISEFVFFDITLSESLDNVPLSYIYNYNITNDFDYFCLLDQDTLISDEYISGIVDFVGSQCDLYLPKILDNGRFFIH